MDNEGKIQELIDRMARLESDSERKEIIIRQLNASSLPAWSF